MKLPALPPLEPPKPGVPMPKGKKRARASKAAKPKLPAQNAVAENETTQHPTGRGRSGANIAKTWKLPYPPKNPKGEAKISLCENPNHPGKVDLQNAVFHLSMHTASLGKVEGLVRVRGDKVETDFTPELAETAALLAEEVRELAVLLELKGFSLLRCSAKPESPDAPPELAQNPFVSRVDFRL